MSIHSVRKSQDHLAWDNSIPPVLTVPSGSEVSFDCTDASNSQIQPHSTLEHIKAFDFARLDQVNGPVFVEGAEPGDILQVDVLEVKTAEWGWTGLIPGFGLLADEYPDPELKIWNIEKDFAWFDEEKGIKIPIRPFAGEMGVAPAEKGAFSTIPPYRTGVS
jgi:acetamidase/formamidase